MRCTSPRTVGFQADGKTIAWSPRQRSKQYAEFQLPCGKCIECRLEYGRSWAVRCVHEAQMHEKSCFITLTYEDPNLRESKLDYSHFQKFMKRLRKLQDAPMGVFVTGEYGEKSKHAHWHALIFGWAPSDGTPSGRNELGDQYYESETLSRIWGLGLCKFGAVTFKSAGYCARYAAKKLGHGFDSQHDFHPISKKSSKHAIGKKWLEKFWPDVFNHGCLVLRDGSTSSIPRYYEKWLKEHHPASWLRYLDQVKLPKCDAAQKSSFLEISDWKRRLYVSEMGARPLSPNEVRAHITKSKFELLQKGLKL